VIIVDDNEVFRTSLRLLLEDYGIFVAGEGEDGTEAIRLVAQLDPDVVVMDLRMPDMDGIQACQAIKADRPEVKVILLSAYDDMALRADAARADVDDYLIKGADPAQVKDAVMSAFEGAAR
jgi:DNA-binding NarL/FixJ family response regulator